MSLNLQGRTDLILAALRDRDTPYARQVVHDLTVGVLKLAYVGTETELKEALRKAEHYHTQRIEADAENEALRDRVSDLERRLAVAKSWVDTLEKGLGGILDDVTETLETMRVSRGLENI